MFALTVRQPYASLLVLGFKEWETRTWPTRHRGPLLIHAAAFTDAEGRRVADLPPVREFLRGEGYGSIHDLPRGAIIGQVRVLDCLPIREAHPKSQEEYLIGHWKTAAYAWRTGDGTPLAVPVRCKGSLGLWEVPHDLVAKVRDAGTWVDPLVS